MFWPLTAVSTKLTSPPSQVVTLWDCDSLGTVSLPKREVPVYFQEQGVQSEPRQRAGQVWLKGEVDCPGLQRTSRVAHQRLEKARNTASSSHRGDQLCPRLI